MYKPITLTYNYDALEPYLNGEIIDLHYNKHYIGYLNNLNSILTRLKYDYRYTLIELINNIDIFPIEERGDILYNIGGILNHELYFKNMSDKKNNLPVGKLKDKINATYGNFENFKELFIKTANSMVGSGYTFLVINNNQLQIINTSNQETPYLYGFIPIMTIDLWEHAYYLQYKNDRKSYILNFFNIVDFEVISNNYEEKEEI